MLDRSGQRRVDPERVHVLLLRLVLVAAEDVEVLLGLLDRGAGRRLALIDLLLLVAAAVGRAAGEDIPAVVLALILLAHFDALLFNK